MRRFVVIGLGNFGATAAVELAASGHEVAALDIDPVKVDHVADDIRLARVGDGTDRQVLEELGAEPGAVGIVSTGRDVTASALVVTGLRDCGVEDVYAKVISELHARVLQRVGVLETVFPEREAARWLVRRVVSRSVLNYVDLGAGLSAQEMAVPESWAGRTLRELELPREKGVTVIAVRDALNGQVVTAPDPDIALKDSDALFLAGRAADLAKLDRS